MCLVVMELTREAHIWYNNWGQKLKGLKDYIKYIILSSKLNSNCVILEFTILLDIYDSLRMKKKMG